MDKPLGQLIAKGRTAEVYTLSDDRVIKLFYDWCPANWIQQEIEIADLISTMSIPTPTMLESVEIEGRQGIVYERVNGPSLLKEVMTKPWMVIHYARQLAELHAGIHKNQVDTLSSQRTALITVIQNLECLSSELKAKVLKLLDELPDDNILGHFDLHPDQVIISDNDLVVIDWMTARQGHPLSDVARTCVMLKFGGVPHGNWVMRKSVELWRGIFYRTYLKRYLEMYPGVSQEEINNWMIPVAAARLVEAIPDEADPILSFIRSYFNQ